MTEPAAAEKRELDIGYVRLTDAAPLLVAQELGLYQELGLTVRLRQEVSWASVRDKLVTGVLDAAQLLAPLPAMTRLGTSGVRSNLMTALVLSRNGNGITVSQSLAEQLAHSADRRAELDMPLTLATVHGFSTHTLLLRRWLGQLGVDPDRDVRLIVVPPTQMVDSLSDGLIDGFCVGEPWNSIAVTQGVGVLIAAGHQVWPAAPEKVLATTDTWHTAHVSTHLRLRMALLRACEWLELQQHREQAAEILARPEYLDLPIEQIRPSLCSSMDEGEHQRFHLFGGGLGDLPVNGPDAGSLLPLLEACTAMLGKSLSAPRMQQLLQTTYRADLFEQSHQAYQRWCVHQTGAAVE